MSTINVKYNLGDVVYFIVKSKVDIFKATVTKVYLKPEGNRYRVTLDDPLSYLGKTFIDYMEESELHETFPTAKAELLAWLDAAIEEISNRID